jgi:hypothetical protein
MSKKKEYDEIREEGLQAFLVRDTGRHQRFRMPRRAFSAARSPSAMNLRID